MSFRKEEKLLAIQNKIPELIEWVFNNGGKKLFPDRIVSSTYFDNDSLAMFNDSEDGVVPRKKIRVRSYDTQPHYQSKSLLEVKISSIEGRFKTSQEVTNIKRLFQLGYYDSQYGLCFPKTRVTYIRSYFEIFNIRLTIDKDIKYTLSQKNRESKLFINEPKIIVELKAPNHVSTEFLSKKFNFQRIRFSKYANSIDMIYANQKI